MAKTQKHIFQNKVFIHYIQENLNGPSDGWESSLSQTNLISLLSRVIKLEDQRNITDIWYLVFSNHLTITHDDRSCGQGGEMWFQWDCGGAFVIAETMLPNEC